MTGSYAGIVLLCVLLGMVCGTVSSAPTTELTMMTITPDGAVEGQRTVTCQWMEANLPVQGDGVVHYYHQGPVFTEDTMARWDPGETTNFKDRGAVKGTDVRDLCDLAGGMEPGDEVMIHAVDGYHVEFPYENVYTFQPRQGPLVICWFNGEDAEVGERQGTGYPPDFYAGMRLVFFADTSTNAEGLHVFGNWDMHEVFPPDKVHLFDDLYPSTNGYTVKWVDEVRIYQGGYHGATDSPVESIVTPTPTAPVGLVLVLFALCSAAVISGWRKP